MVDRKVFWTKRYAIDDDAPFQSKWILRVLNRSNMSMAQLAEKLHLTRQNISKLVHGESRISFATVVAIWYVCELHEEDPEEILKTIEEDWKERKE